MRNGPKLVVVNRSPLRRVKANAREPSTLVLAAVVAMTVLGFGWLTAPTARQGLPAAPTAAAARATAPQPATHRLAMAALTPTKPDVPLTGW